jgi:hypothetical protein
VRILDTAPAEFRRTEALLERVSEASQGVVTCVDECAGELFTTENSSTISNS